MFQKTFFIFLLCFSSLQSLISQVEYTVTFRGDAQNGYPSSLLADNDFIFSTHNMRGGYTYERDYSVIAKIDAQGKIVDSLMFLPQSDTIISYVWDIQKTSQTGVYSGCGIKRYQGEERYVWLFEFNDKMQVLWGKIIDTINFSPMRMEHHAIGENRYVFCSTSNTANITCLYNFNKTSDTVIKNNSYRGGVDFLCPIPPENNTFLINDPSNSSKTIVLDSSFEKIKDAVIFADHYSQPPDCEFIDDTQFVVVRRNLLTAYGPRSLVMTKVDVPSMDIMGTKHFGYESFEKGLGMLGVHKAIAVQKDYFFVFGASSLQGNPTPVVPFDNNFFLYAFNHDLDSIWSLHLDFDAYYWPFSIAATPDGGCVIGATRYDWHTEETNYFCDAFIAKIPKPDFTSIPQIEKPQAFATIYPNPGSHHFLIQTELSRFTLQLYDLQGQLLLTQQNQKEVETEKLPSGCYIYRIIAENGMTTSGKWVKK